MAEKTLFFFDSLKWTEKQNREKFTVSVYYSEINNVCKNYSGIFLVNNEYKAKEKLSKE